MTASGVAAAWARRVRANREQVDRLREVPDGTDFYAPVSAFFVDDPRRTGDATLDALLALAEPGETWLDIGAGAGRFALPLALRVRRVIAIERSPSMAAALRAAMDEHQIGNVEVLEATWPMAAEARPAADVSLIAHVGYDIEEIGPFLDAMEAAAGRRCAAILMDRSPQSVADPFWVTLHGEERVSLPALPELLDLLHARGRRPTVRHVHRHPRRWPSEEALLGGLRHQLWVAERSAKDERLRAAVAARLRREDDGVWVDGGPTRIGIVDWAPRRS